MSLSLVELPLEADCVHAPTDHPWWQESVLLAWHDSAQDIGGFIRIGQQVNRGLAKCTFGITSRNGPCYLRSRQDLPLQDSDRDRNRFSVDGFLSARFERGRSYWEARDSHCELTLTVTDAHPTYDFYSMTTANVFDKLMANHVQVGGTVEGTLRLGEIRTNISGFIFRDHSWGPRVLHEAQADISAFGGLLGSFGSDFSFGFGEARTRAGRPWQFGYIFKEGVHDFVKIEDFVIETDFRDGLSTRGARATVTTERFGQLVVEAVCSGNVPLEMEQKYFEIQAPCLLVCAGRCGGGLLSTIYNPRDGTARPVWLASAALVNGPYRAKDGVIVRDPDDVASRPSIPASGGG